ncbi:MAG: ATP phosphoribosyltransferase regulatory subunit [Candidatus Gracilibacteria bacterium]|nr:ATP phosphoribosyltransferase regulatory subunit [Candidatus Gracilibacteria bacterium]
MTGIHNYLPDDHKYFTFLKKVFRHEFRKNGFRRIGTVFFENKDLLETVYGEDFIQENIFLVENNKGLKINPHFGNLNAYLSGELRDETQPVYLYNIDKYFTKSISSYTNNYENYFIGGDIIGETDPILDSMLIYMTYSTLNKMGLQDTFKISLNCVLNKKELENYLQDLKDFYENKKHLLSEEGLKKLETNPIEILNGKSENEIILAKETPNVMKYMKKDSKEYFNKLLGYLEMLKVPYILDNLLTPEFSYSSNSTWIITKNDTDKIISRGGRYNNLAKLMGNNKDIGAVGFTINVDYLIEMIKENNIKIKNKDELDLYFIQLGDDAKKIVFNLSLEARERGIKTMVSLGTPSMKEQILKAQRVKAKFIVIVGFMEAKNGAFQVRDTIKGTQEEIKKENLLDYIIGKIGEENLDFYCPIKDLIIE